jgi:hypothetical protein
MDLSSTFGKPGQHRSDERPGVIFTGHDAEVFRDWLAERDGMDASVRRWRNTPFSRSAK